MSIYSDLLAAGVPLDSHESDLYAKDTPETRAVLAQYPEQDRKPFRSAVDGAIWFDLPFRFDPFWEAKS